MTDQASNSQQSARRALLMQATRVVVGIETSRGPECSGIVWNADTVVMAAEALRGADSVRGHTWPSDRRARYGISSCLGVPSALTPLGLQPHERVSALPF